MVCFAVFFAMQLRVAIHKTSGNSNAPMPYNKMIMAAANNSSFQRALLLYKKNPQFFAPLADLYRRAGDRDQALSLCQKGVRLYPHYAYGRIVHALVMLDLNKLDQAAMSLEKAVELSPENILAYKLLGQIYLKKRNPEKTLQAYKMVLLLDPQNQRAARVVKKLSLAAGPSPAPDDTGFVSKSAAEVSVYLSPDKSSSSPPLIHPTLKTAGLKEQTKLQSRLQMIETLIHKQNFKKARDFLTEMHNLYSDQSGLKPRLNLLEEQLNKAMSLQAAEGENNLAPKSPPGTPAEEDDIARAGRAVRLKEQRRLKIQKLQSLLARINTCLAEQRR